ncbi:TPA: DUF551 domain-containing protein [Acinetobacter baumannii]|uniref:DUF551 domain-containing protein n=1 Tax=Acinetobacter calcoaceticus/baumannii complex TaxID=909768 RepID=UPI000BF43B72|nr:MULTISPECIES: DUF551 domain-containing protein [Acinetobacter calcoaceticus/baumannii complex]MBJ9455197.1 DUF551 domain-containing protein [Acinetobacter baumannii]MBJ9700979.1 DUF551 domain-containing protein [Acinetobacter baumannii]MDC4840245.1 DUF551 domain-containing protein [Acinetobacter baumannii]MDC5147197.1 DUF551 domain-containing protein [Acinetobacter baumannii]MDC5216077.1 DUF551 domain-containing protein [Acinetobacter baumannii]
MIDLNQELEDFDAYFFKRHGELPLDPTSEEYANKSYLKHEMFKAWKARAKAQAVPTWISVTDELPPTDIMVLICWADAPDITPEQDYMTIDEDLNSVWANYHNDPPSHWMHFHSVPNVSGAANE